MARYKRMQGLEVFYPIGWDDNGLPTERRVQNYYGVRGDATLPYVEDYEFPFSEGVDAKGKAIKPADQQPISRKNFIELCDILTVKDEVAFESLWRRLGFSLDWNISYRTIDERSRAVAQQAFLRNLARGEAYQSEAPGLGRDLPGRWLRRAEARDYPAPTTGSPSTVMAVSRCTSRRRARADPSVVALIAHPTTSIPTALSARRCALFGVEVPVLAHRAAEMDKGAGIAMVLHLRRPHRRHVVARAEVAHPLAHHAQRAPAGGDARGSRVAPESSCMPLSWLPPRSAVRRGRGQGASRVG